MFSLPWVARSTLEAVADERDRLREKNDELQDHLVRIARRKEKMSEAPREGNQKEKGVRIPAEVRGVIEAWDSPTTRQMLESRARQLYAQRRDWEYVRDKLETEVNE